MQLMFDDDLAISIESKCTMHKGDRETGSWTPDDLSRLQPLIEFFGAKIISYKVYEKGTLTVGFSTGVVLKIYDSNSDFESYQISSKHTVTVV